MKGKIWKEVLALALAVVFAIQPIYAKNRLSPTQLSEKTIIQDSKTGEAPAEIYGSIYGSHDGGDDGDKDDGGGDKGDGGGDKGDGGGDKGDGGGDKGDGGGDKGDSGGDKGDSGNKGNGGNGGNGSNNNGGSADNGKNNVDVTVTTQKTSNNKTGSGSNSGGANGGDGQTTPIPLDANGVPVGGTAEDGTKFYVWEENKMRLTIYPAMFDLAKTQEKNIVMRVVGTTEEMRYRIRIPYDQVRIFNEDDLVVDLGIGCPHRKDISEALDKKVASSLLQCQQKDLNLKLFIGVAVVGDWDVNQGVYQYVFKEKDKSKDVKETKTVNNVKTDSPVQLKSYTYDNNKTNNKIEFVDYTENYTFELVRDDLPIDADGMVEVEMKAGVDYLFSNEPLPLEGKNLSTFVSGLQGLSEIVKTPRAWIAVLFILLALIVIATLLYVLRKQGYLGGKKKRKQEPEIEVNSRE